MIETTQYAPTIDRSLTPVPIAVRQPAVSRFRRRFWGSLDRFDLFCLLGLLLTFLVLSRLPFSVSKFSDIYFHEEAKQLARVVKGVDSWKEVRIARAPAPVLYYAVPYLFVSLNASEETYWRSAVIWNALWLAASLLLIRRAGAYLAGERTGKIAVLITLVLPFAAYYSFGISSEPPAYAGAAVFAYGWARWRKNDFTKLLSPASWIALLGLVVLCLSRPNAIVVLGLAGICALALSKSSSPRRSFDTRFAVVCMVVGFASVIFVSFVIQHLPDKRGVRLQATNFADVMLFGDFQFRKEPWDWRFWGKSTRSGSVDYQDWVDVRKELILAADTTGIPLSRLEMNWSIRDIVHHPVERFKMVAVRALALNVWIVNSTSPERFHFGPLPNRTGFLFFHVLLNTFALLPLIASVWFLAKSGKEFFGYWPLWAPWLGLLLFHSFVYAEPRYMLPGQIGVNLMAAALLSHRLQSDKSLQLDSKR